MYIFQSYSLSIKNLIEENLNGNYNKRRTKSQLIRYDLKIVINFSSLKSSYLNIIVTSNKFEREKIEEKCIYW